MITRIFIILLLIFIAAELADIHESVKFIQTDVAYIRGKP